MKGYFFACALCSILGTLCHAQEETGFRIIDTLSTQNGFVLTRFDSLGKGIQFFYLDIDSVNVAIADDRIDSHALFLEPYDLTSRIIKRGVYNYRIGGEDLLDWNDSLIYKTEDYSLHKVFSKDGFVKWVEKTWVFNAPGVRGRGRKILVTPQEFVEIYSPLHRQMIIE